MNSGSCVDVTLEYPVIGLDGALSKFGIASGGVSKSTWLETFASTNRGPDRLLDIKNRLEEVLTDNPTAVVLIEAYPPNTHDINNLFQMGALHAIIEMAVYTSGREYYYVTPQQVKKFASGSAKTPKNQLGVWAYKEWGLDITQGLDDNQIDAFILAKLGEAMKLPDSRLKSQHKACVASVLEYTTKHYPWAIREPDKPAVPNSDDYGADVFAIENVKPKKRRKNAN